MQHLWTPLHCAAEKGTIGNIEILIEKGADLLCKDKLSVYLNTVRIVTRVCSFMIRSYLINPQAGGAYSPSCRGKILQKQQTGGCN